MSHGAFVDRLLVDDDCAARLLMRQNFRRASDDRTASRSARVVSTFPALKSRSRTALVTPATCTT